MTDTLTKPTTEASPQVKISSHNGFSEAAQHAPEVNLALDTLVEGIEVPKSFEDKKGQNVIIAEVRSPFSTPSASPQPVFEIPTYTEDKESWRDPQTAVAHTWETLFLKEVSVSMKGD